MLFAIDFETVLSLFIIRSTSITLIFNKLFLFSEKMQIVSCFFFFSFTFCSAKKSTSVAWFSSLFSYLLNLTSWSNWVIYLNAQVTYNFTFSISNATLDLLIYLWLITSNVTQILLDHRSYQLTPLLIITLR